MNTLGSAITQGPKYFHYPLDVITACARWYPDHSGSAQSESMYVFEKLVDEIEDL